jgi:heme/copper-type cytochrome/quinol oxidase subunit 2
MKGLLTGWLALIVVLAVLFFIKLMINAALRSEGKSIDWRAYNTVMLVIAFAAVIPIAIILLLAKIF